MEHVFIKLPHRVIQSLKEHYPGYSLITVKQDVNGRGQKLFFVNILHGDKYCRLCISDEGKILQEKAEPQFDNDAREQYF